ncbi:hypothetical protein AB0L53_14905 [Nonomuraea sp. NPDC052129]|uniref:hypothetical protein n=1 Tax=Nonomuraea sp. NPDC052129 TaxID=3154651 RepID=UPI003437645F
MAHPWKNRQRAGVVAFGAVAMLVLMVSAVVSVAIVTTTATGTAREPSGASSGERIRLAEAAEPVPSSTPETSQEPATSPSPSVSDSPESSAAASPRPSPTWTGRAGGEVYYGTFSEDECVKRGEEGVAAQKWSAYSCKALVKRDETTKDGERVDEPGEVGELGPGQATRDHGLWVVDWLCMIRMEEGCS